MKISIVKLDMKVTVYTIPNCPFCKQEKDYLTSKGVKFEEKDVQSNKEHLTEMLNVSNKFAGVPFTVIEKDGGEKVMLKGFTQSEFDAALGGSSDAAKPATPVTPASDMPKPAAPMAGTTPPAAAPKADAPKVDSSKPMGDTAKPAAPMSATTPPVAPKPVTNDAMKSPMAGNMDSTPKPATPAGGDMPKPAAPMPSAPAGETNSAAPKVEDAGDPQKELSGLLKDLESKTGSTPAAPNMNGGTPTPTSTPTPAAPKPAAPVTPPASGSTPPAAAPSVPDFNKQS